MLLDIKLRFRGIDSRNVDLSVVKFLQRVKLLKDSNPNLVCSVPILIPRRQEKLNTARVVKDDFYGNKVRFDRIVVLKNVEDHVLGFIKESEVESGIGVEIRTRIIF